MMTTGEHVNFSDFNERQKIVGVLANDLRNDWDEAFIKLRQYENHESDDLKRDIFALVWQIGTGLDDRQKRQQLVRYLLNGVLNGTSFIRGQALKFLMDFEPLDFDGQTVEVLESLFWDDECGSAIIRLIGIANVRSKIPELKELAGTEWQDSDLIKLYASQQWMATLVLARMGESVYNERIIQKVQSEPDIIVRATELFQDLAYTKQQTSFDALRNYLLSEERLPQVKETVPGMLEAIYAASVLVRHVDGCPVEGLDVSESEIDIIRNWAEAQAEWNIKNLPLKK